MLKHDKFDFVFSYIALSRFGRQELQGVSLREEEWK
jgi:hypothetical protein